MTKPCQPQPYDLDVSFPETQNLCWIFHSVFPHTLWNEQHLKNVSFERVHFPVPLQQTTETEQYQSQHIKLSLHAQTKTVCTLWGMTSVHLTCLMQWIKNRNSLKTWNFWYDQFSLCLTVQAERLWLISSPSSVPACSGKREVKVRSYWVSNQSVTLDTISLFLYCCYSLTAHFYIYFTFKCILNAI